MKIDALTVTLRPRTPWEAIELGMALTRRHAKVIGLPWLVLTLPVLVLSCAAGLALHAPWLPAVLMWWLKPLFDRVPLYVLSRATFGDVPTLRQSLRAQWRWGSRWMGAYLTWRRLGPVRALYLPVDLLEGSVAERARARRRDVGQSIYGVSLMLTVMCCLFSAVLQLGLIGVALVFIPNVYLSSVFEHAGAVLKTSPWWLTLIFNGVAWLVTSIVEPFYIGAGFGLYINRRTQLEAWDIELTFRRLRERLTQAATVLACVLALGLAVVAPGYAMPAAAPVAQAGQGGGEAGSKQAAEDGSVAQIFGAQRVDGGAFRQAVNQAYADPTLSPKRTEHYWRRRHPIDDPSLNLPNVSGPNLSWLGGLIAVIGKFGLWALAGALVLTLVLTAKRWAPWFAVSLRRGSAHVEDSVRQQSAPPPEALPDDVPTTVRQLWYAGRQREALALLYRATVEAMASQTRVMLVPGATEAECLRASRRLMAAEDRDAFARIVRVWQYAAYAQSYPTVEAFESLLLELKQRFVGGPVELPALPLRVAS